MKRLELTLGDLADEHLALVVPGDDARRRPGALLVHDHLGLSPFHDRDHAVGRAEVDADDLAHSQCLQFIRDDEAFRGSEPSRGRATEALVFLGSSARRLGFSSLHAPNGAWVNLTTGVTASTA